MKPLHKILTMFLTVVFIYSATGQAIVFHYCNQKAIACETKSCCDETQSEDNCCNPSEETGATIFKCCTTTGEYFVNPFGVQQPDQKKAISHSELIVFLNNTFQYSSTGFTLRTSYTIDSGFDPPGRSILLQKSLLVI